MKHYESIMQHLLLVLAGLVCTISVKAASYDFKAENSDGVTIYYKINGDEATVVEGDEKYKGAVVIPETVTVLESPFNSAPVWNATVRGQNGLNNINTSSVTDMSDMLENCHELVGGNGTKYDANYTNKTYARS